MKNNVVYLVLFSLTLAGVVYLSLPSERTLVEMSRDDDDAERTGQLLRRRANRNPENVSSALELAEFLAGGGEDEEAVAVLSAINARVPGDARVRVALGMALLRRGELAAALEATPEPLRSREFLLRAADGFETEGDLLRAEEMLSRAWADDAKTADYWRRIAQWRWDGYDTPGAAEALRRALELEPGDIPTLEKYYTNRAWDMDADETMRVAAELEKLVPPDRMHLNALLEAQLSLREMEGAAETLRRIAALPDASIEEALRFATFLYWKGDRERSDAELLRLAAQPGLSHEARVEIAEQLEYSAVNANNLELAMRLPELAPDEESINSARLVAVDVAMLAGRFDLAAEHIGPLLADPGADADTVRTGLELAYRVGDFAALPDLHERAAGLGVPIEDLMWSIPDEAPTVDQWRAAMTGGRGGAYAMAGWLRAALRNGNEALSAETPPPPVPRAEIAAVLEDLLPALDPRAILLAVPAVEALDFLAASEPDADGQNRLLERAADLADAVVDGPMAGNAAFLLEAADVNERLGRIDAAERLWRLAARADAEDPWSRLALARTAAARSDPGRVEEAIRFSEARGDARTGGEVRGLIYSCLSLADALRDDRPAEADHWLARAGELYRQNARLLPDSEVDNLALRADLAERAGDPEAALAGWTAMVGRDPKLANAWLGVSRANIALGRPDAAWEALERAKTATPANDLDQTLDMSWQLLNASDALPEGDPARDARRDEAHRYASGRLARGWNRDLALALFWRSLDGGGLDEARVLARRLGAAPDVRAALAEALLAAERPGEARSEALAASASEDADVLLRMVYVLVQTGDRDRAAELLARVEKAAPEETPERLLRMADAYGSLDDFGRQYALAEKRARAGGEPEWLDAVDRRIWGGDLNGASALLNEAAALYPDSVAVVDRAVSLLVDLNRPGEATETFSRAANRIAGLEGELSADALAALGVAYDDLRSTPRARRFFRLSLDKEPGNKRGCLGNARLLSRDGNLPGAIRLLRRYVETEPEDPWGWLDLANTRTMAEQNGRPEYRRVIELTEPGADGEIPREIRAARAVALRALGREKEALALLRGEVGPVVDNPDVACDYAQMLMELRQYDEAERVLRETVRAFPNHVWAYRLEATVLVRRQRYDLAVARLKEALQWAPHDGEVQRDLGFAAQLWERAWTSQKSWLSAGGR